MKRLVRLCTPLTFLLLSGCATQGSLDTVRNDLDSVKTRLFIAEKDLAGTRDKSDQVISSVEKSFNADVAAVRKISADIQATIDSARNEMQILNGKVDDVTITVKKQNDEMTRYREDADKRIAQLEDRILKLQTALDDYLKKSGESIPPKNDVQTPDALYMKGLETFKSNNMPAARDQFAKFLEQYPKHKLAGNAHYWIGETYYGEKNYEAAILAYQEVIKNYPQQEKVPAAMLKQSLSFKAIKDAKSTKYVLKKLIQTFPKSTEAKRAKELLKELR